MGAPLLLSRHLWVWPFLGAVVLGVVAFWVRGRVEGATRSELGSRLETLLKADIAALRLWFSEREYDANSFAADRTIQTAISQLAALSKDRNISWQDVANSEPAQTLELYLAPGLEAQHYLDYFVISADRHVLAWPHHPRLVGRTVGRGSVLPAYELFINRALGGKPTVSRPFAWDFAASQHVEGPTMFVAAPVKSTNGTIIAALGLRMAPEKEFSQIFSVARMGETGESYAFDRWGYLLTASRFDDELKLLGLIPDEPGATSILNLRLSDPGVELKTNGLPGKLTNALPEQADLPFGGHGRTNRIRLPRAARPGGMSEGPPLTQMASAATKGLDGVDVEGYRNYRGVKVVGAWAWLPEYAMGVATEVSANEAFQTLYMLRQAFMVMFALVVVSGIAIFAFTLAVERLQSSVRKSALAARRLGQYVLVQEIGRGANGMVYRARHSLLRRPVAIKLLSPDLTNETTAARFEHEVQITSQLTHPNTVAIYDYGHTPEGLFYYAMEYLSGIDLDQLVRQFGPQPEGRVIHILRQVCGSLAEAHRIGLIHRDIKPANIVLTRRGGVCDVVKVLDFGLVKARHKRAADATAVNAIVGTPHFISPEAVESPATVEARSDLYSVGAVGYWLLTGNTLFDSHQVEEIFNHHVRTMPAHPGERVGRELSEDLAALIMSCLAKEPDKRPASAEALEQALNRCCSAGTWTTQEAAAWWQTHLAGVEAPPPLTMAEKTLVIAPRN
jgi:tRNA A-37 threonylcarbamoyl transferase component Bud32